MAGGVVISGAVEGDVQLSRELLTLDASLSTFREPLTQAKTQLLSTTQLNFGAVGALMGGWQPRTRAYPWPLLEKTGRMRGGFKSKVGTNRMEIWNPTIYFKYHQSNRPRKKLPRRVMLKIIGQDKKRIQKFFQTWIAGEIKSRKRS